MEAGLLFLFSFHHFLTIDRLGMHLFFIYFLFWFWHFGMMLELCMIGVVLGWCTEIDPRVVNPPWLYGYIFFALLN